MSWLKARCYRSVLTGVLLDPLQGQPFPSFPSLLCLPLESTAYPFLMVKRICIHNLIIIYFPSLYPNFAWQGNASMHRPSPPAGDTPPYEKVQRLPNKGPGLYSFPLSVVGILNLGWTSLEKSSLHFDANALQHSSKLSMVLQGKSRIQSLSYHFIYLLLRDKVIYAKPAALFRSALAHSCSIAGRRRTDMLQCESLSLQVLFCNSQSRSGILNFGILISN